MVVSWLRRGSRRDEPAVASATVPTAQRREALLLAADRARRLTPAVYELGAQVEAEAKARDWTEGPLIALFRDGMPIWSTLFAYGLLRTRHALMAAAGAIDAGAGEEWAMASVRLAEQVAGQDAAGVGDAARLTPTIANLLRQFDSVAAQAATLARQAPPGDADAGAPCGPLRELASHGFGGPGDGPALAARFDPVIAALAPAAEALVRRVYDAPADGDKAGDPA